MLVINLSCFSKMLTYAKCIIIFDTVTTNEDLFGHGATGVAVDTAYKLFKLYQSAKK